jgi:cellulase
MAYCGQESCDGIPGADLDWFKIQEDSFADGHWPTERINYDTNHTWSFNLPTDLRSGKYLVRHEL